MTVLDYSVFGTPSTCVFFQTQLVVFSDRGNMVWTTFVYMSLLRICLTCLNRNVNTFNLFFLSTQQLGLNHAHTARDTHIIPEGKLSPCLSDL